MTDEEIAREAAENILEIPVLNRYMIPEMANIILAAINQATEEEMKMVAVAKVCEIYFNIAAEAIGEDAVRRRRDELISIDIKEAKK